MEPLNNKVSSPTSPRLASMSSAFKSLPTKHIHDNITSFFPQLSNNNNNNNNNINNNNSSNNNKSSFSTDSENTLTTQQSPELRERKGKIPVVRATITQQQQSQQQSQQQQTDSQNDSFSSTTNTMPNTTTTTPIFPLIQKFAGVTAIVTGPIETMRKLSSHTPTDEQSQQQQQQQQQPQAQHHNIAIPAAIKQPLYRFQQKLMQQTQTDQQDSWRGTLTSVGGALKRAANSMASVLAEPDSNEMNTFHNPKHQRESSLSSCPEGYLQYQCQPNETFAGIAMKFHMRLTELNKINRLTSPSPLPAQVIIVKRPQTAQHQQTQSVSSKNEASSSAAAARGVDHHVSRGVGIENKWAYEVLTTSAKYVLIDGGMISGQITLSAFQLVFDSSPTDKYTKSHNLCAFQLHIPILAFRKSTIHSRSMISLDATRTTPSNSGTTSSNRPNNSNHSNNHTNLLTLQQMTFNPSSLDSVIPADNSQGISNNNINNNNDSNNNININNDSNITDNTNTHRNNANDNDNSNSNNNNNNNNNKDSNTNTNTIGTAHHDTTMIHKATNGMMIRNRSASMPSFANSSSDDLEQPIVEHHVFEITGSNIEETVVRLHTRMHVLMMMNGDQPDLLLEETSHPMWQNTSSTAPAISTAGSQLTVATENSRSPSPPHRDQILPTLDNESDILEEKHIRRLVRALPISLQFSHNWYLLYSLQRNGVSLQTFFRTTAFQGPNILVLRDQDNHIFGGFASSSWENNPKYYGTGESFVFQLQPKNKVYPWSQKNEYFMISTLDAICMGGGGHYAFSLDNELLHGSSDTCETFGSPCLASASEFQCVALEVWGFQKPKKPDPKKQYY